MYEFNH